MNNSIVRRIKDMGYDLDVTLEQIDEFVDECISFLKREQAHNLDFSNDIFEIENARQEAFIAKYSTTFIPL